eukprot:4667354-Pyramimonas_sp.AAC.2
MTSPLVFTGPPVQVTARVHTPPQRPVPHRGVYPRDRARKGEGSLGCLEHPCRYRHRRARADDAAPPGPATVPRGVRRAEDLVGLLRLAPRPAAHAGGRGGDAHRVAGGTL